MMPLAELQQAWLDYLFKGRTHRLQPFIASQKPSASLLNLKALNASDHSDHLSHLKRAGRSDSLDRLAIYGFAYEARLVECIEKTFPCLKKIMGEILFQKHARCYLKSYRSRHYSVGTISQAFPRFLKKHSSLFYAQMALFEWSVSLILDENDEAPETMTALNELPTDDGSALVFDMQPSLKMLCFAFPVPLIYTAALQKKRVVLKAVAKHKNKHKKKSDFYYALFRKNFQAYYLSLTAQDYFFLKHLQKKQPLGLVCEKLSRRVHRPYQPNDEQTVIDYALQQLQLYFSENLITRVSYRE